MNVGRSTGGVRGCKASAWEGGIRVPGFVVWPGMISEHRETWVPAVTHDFLPTIMEAIGVISDHPSWALDGVSLMPFITGPPAGIPTARPKPIGFWWGSLQAWIDNDMKLTNAQGPGQGCVEEAPWLNGSATANGGFRLFNLSAGARPNHMDYNPSRWPQSTRIVKRCAARASNGPNHLGLRALQTTPSQSTSQASSLTTGKRTLRRCHALPRTAAGPGRDADGLQLPGLELLAPCWPRCRTIWRCYPHAIL